MKKHALVLCRPFNQFSKKFFQDFDLYGVDAGCQTFLDHQTNFQIALGDFDSFSSLNKLHQLAKQVLLFESEKDDTDLELLLKKIGSEYEQIFCYISGQRNDHLLAQFFLCLQYPNVVFFNEFNFFHVLSQNINFISFKEYPFVSFFAFEEIYLKITGLHWSYNSDLQKNKFLISNKFDDLKQTAKIQVNLKNKLLCIESSDKPCWKNKNMQIFLNQLQIR